ncbi:MAG: hypothetical protein RLZZ571_904 [Actinomycetota bacterium]
MSLDGIVLVDKPEGPTSHDVVAKARRIFGTRKIGHAGTLDPMATGMLVLGVGKATRLLGYLTATDKEYLGTIRLGQATNTDDAQGEITSSASTAKITDEDILNAVRDFRGPISQKPSSVSAIKVNGKRAYALVRGGEEVDLPARDVMIHDFEIISITHEKDTIDVKVRVVCSAGTYIRALARDLGIKLNVGGHLTELRRTRSGKFTQMRPLVDIENTPSVIELADAVKMTFPTVEISGDEIKRAKNGMRITTPIQLPAGMVGVFANSGDVISLCEHIESELVPVVVFN